jgi:hypothetical protein
MVGNDQCPTGVVRYQKSLLPIREGSPQETTQNLRQVKTITGYSSLHLGTLETSILSFPFYIKSCMKRLN